MYKALAALSNISLGIVTLTILRPFGILQLLLLIVVINAIHSKKELDFHFSQTLIVM